MIFPVLLLFLLYHPLSAIETERASPGWEDVPAILAAISTPEIAPRVFRVEELGGIGDGQHDDRAAIQAALAQAAAAGGGRVILTSGHSWFSKGPLHLLSNVELHIEEGAVLRFSQEPSDYLPQVLTRWEGTEVFNYSPFIYAYQASNVALTGRGRIEGNAQNSFAHWRSRQGAAQQRLRRMGAEQVPVFERVFGEGDYLRPSMVQFFACQRVLIEDVEIVDSPFWVLHLVACDTVIVRGVRVESPRLNNDGIDIESSSNVLIENSRFITGDDSIVIKSGRDEDGRRLARPSERVIIRNNYMHGHNGLAIGSEMSGGVRYIFMENNQLGDVRSPLYFKSSTERGGVIEDVYIRNIRVQSSSQPLLRLIMDYQGQRDGEHIPIFRNIHIENVVAERVAEIFQIQGNPLQPIQSLRIRNIHIAAIDLSQQQLAEQLRIDKSSQHLLDVHIEDIFIADTAVDVMVQ